MKTTAFLILLLALVSCKTPSTHDPDLIGWWSFEDASANLAPDHSVNILNAINKGAVQVEGKIGKALHFDGKSVLQIDYQPLLDSFPKGITIAAWIKKDSASLWNTIVSREIGDGWSEYFGLAVNQNKALFSVDPDGKNYQNVKAEETLLPDVWVHLAGTFDNETYKLYINGKLIKSAVCKSQLHFIDQNPLLIGGNSNNQNKTLVDCFVGTIDEVRIYKRTLTLPEIYNLSILTCNKLDQ